MTNELFIKKIKERRKSFKYSQKYLAELVGVTEVTVSNYELGYSMPIFKYIFKITEVLKMNLFIKSKKKKETKKYIITNFSDLGNFFVLKRKELNLSQARLYRISNIVSGTMYRIEKGIASPSFNTVNKILYSLQMELDVEDKE